VTDSVHKTNVGPRRRRFTIPRMGALAATLALAGVFTAMALASSPVTIDSAANAKLNEKVLVNEQGRTLYVLTPETAKHLLCTSGECLKFWPPLTVSSASAKVKLASGVHGKIGILHRSNGMLQVTLNDQPLYRFAEDQARGEVNGQNLKGFGGTWHVVSTAGVASSAMPVSSAASANSSTPASGAPAASTPAGSAPAASMPPTSAPAASAPTTSTPATSTSSTPGW
jgi:predicted lipoprotein with Yx(FWY)xxD motif